MPIGIGTVYFASAGRWDLPGAWAVFGILAVLTVAAAATADPGLVRERVKPGPGNRDKLTRPVSIAMLFAHWILAGLDAGRFHWSPVPLGWQFLGAAGYGLAMVFLFWVMRTNPFYSSVVRVQTDRGHHPVVSGPYRLVRHPGYAATLFGVLAGGLALGSWLALIPLLVLGAAFVRRTLLEDRLLREELAGYAEYAQRVRYLLLARVF